MRGPVLVAVLLASVTLAGQVRLRFIAPPVIPPVGGDSILAAARQAGGGTVVPNVAWANAGVVGGIPSASWTRCTTGTGTSILASSSTAAQINTAITGCNANHYVELGAGTFTVAGAIKLVSNVALRGQGMSTDLNITSDAGSNWGFAGGSGTVTMVGNFPEAADGIPPLEGVPSGTIKTWSGTGGASGVYTQGATVIDLASAPTGLSVGDTLVLYQNNVADGLLPNNSIFFSAKTASGSIAWQGSTYGGVAAQQQRSRVTAINGNAVTIADGLIHPTGTWRTAQTPRAGWLTASRMITNAGIENLRLRVNLVENCDICVSYAYNVWIKGVGLVPKFTSHGAGGAVDFGVIFTDSQHVTIRDSWISTMRGGGFSTFTSYGIAFMETQHFLAENNIFDNVESPTELLVGSMGGVIGYNYERYVGDDAQEGGIQQHEVGSSMVLVEGNTYYKVFMDLFHGNSGLSTYFRNYLTDHGFDIQSYHRCHNLIGNVIDASAVRKTLYTDAVKYDRWSDFAFRFGYASQNPIGTGEPGFTGFVNPDARINETTMVWGNYAPIGGTVFNAAEVPSSDVTCPNPVPPDQVLPNSFYLSARPPFFTVSGIGTLPWPLIGPDVTGGTVTGLAGHANKTPAQRVYEATSGGLIANFNPGLYGS